MAMRAAFCFLVVVFCAFSNGEIDSEHSTVMDQIHQKNGALAAEMSNTKHTQVTYQAATSSQKLAERAKVKARALQSVYNKNIGANPAASVECEGAIDIQCPAGNGWLRVTLRQRVTLLISAAR